MMARADAFEDLPQIEENGMTAEIPQMAYWRGYGSPYPDFDLVPEDKAYPYPSPSSGLDASSIPAFVDHDHGYSVPYWGSVAAHGPSPPTSSGQSFLTHWTPVPLDASRLPALVDDHSSCDESSMGSTHSPSESRHSPESSFAGLPILSQHWPCTDGPKPAIGGVDRYYDRGVHLHDIQPWAEPFPEDQDHFQGRFECGSPEGAPYELGYVVPMEREHTGHESVPVDIRQGSTPVHEITRHEPEMMGDSGSDYRAGVRPARSLTTRTTKSRNKITKVEFKSKAKTGRVQKRQTTGRKSLSATPGQLRSKTGCPQCPVVADNVLMLQKHITVSHTRPFKCTFKLYGCTATFGSKNEWKRHVSSQHLRLSVWRCDLDGCQPRAAAETQQRRAPPADEAEEEELIYNEFNRKDLFTQHLKRMHAAEMPGGTAYGGPEGATRDNTAAKPNPRGAAVAPPDRSETLAWLRTTSDRCLWDVRSPPPRSVCGYCPPAAHKSSTTNSSREVSFCGDAGWEQRMEHVGKHLDAGHATEREWAEDAGLKHWLCSEGLLEKSPLGTWVLTAAGGGPKEVRAREG